MIAADLAVVPSNPEGSQRILNTVMVIDDSEIDLLFARTVLERSGVAHPLLLPE